MMFVVCCSSFMLSEREFMRANMTSNILTSGVERVLTNGGY
jgi:hypothetical protein